MTEENGLLREELTALLAEAHDLVHTVKPNLLAIYQTRIGKWELDLLRVRLEYARLKRQVELVQASLNVGEKPDLVAIEGQLELEFLQWQQRLAEAVGTLEAAEKRLKHLLSPEDSRELKKLYYALVKKLHPDVNPNLTPEQQRLWPRVQEAYEAADIQELRALTLLAEKNAAVAPPPKSLDRLRQNQQTLEKQIHATLKEMEQIQSQPPFTLQATLDDSGWVESRRRELEVQTETLRIQRDALTAHLKILLSGDAYGKCFGKN